MKLYGLVLSGGESKRMGRDKGSLIYPGQVEDQRSRCFYLLQAFCAQTFISCRASQRSDLASTLPVIEDSVPYPGPAAGLLSAHRFDPEAAWLVLACDFPFVDSTLIKCLLEARSPDKAATLFQGESGVLEPLLAIWEPRALVRLGSECLAGNLSPRLALEGLEVKTLACPFPQSLRNANSAVELAQIFASQK